MPSVIEIYLGFYSKACVRRLPFRPKILPENVQIVQISEDFDDFSRPEAFHYLTVFRANLPGLPGKGFSVTGKKPIQIVFNWCSHFRWEGRQGFCDGSGI